MTTTSTLFYGIFAEAIPLIIATQVYSELAIKLNPIIFQLTRLNRPGSTAFSYSTNIKSIYRVPLEIWENIRDKLSSILLLETETKFLFELSCSCCQFGVCEDPKDHESFYTFINTEHAISPPQTYECFKNQFRRCCFDSTVEHFRNYLPDFFNWSSEINITEAKLDHFLSQFNLKTIDRSLVETSRCLFYFIPIGALQSVSLDHDSNIDSNGGVLIVFNYKANDLAFEELCELCGIEGAHSKSLEAYGSKDDVTVASKSQPDWKSGDGVLSTWHLWARTIDTA